MKASDVFSGASLKADDIKGREPVVTIESVEVKTFDDGAKPIIKFVGKDKSLVCNRTNWNSIVEITGEDDSDNWAGHKIKLVVARVDFQGKRVDAIRIEPAPQPSQPPTPRRAPEPPPAPAEAVEAPDEDDIPF
jgi:hypothetical protein